MDRYWLITWTTYGSWVAGDERGFVSNVYSEDGDFEVRHNTPGTECDADMPGLERYVRERMLDAPFYLNVDQAEVMIGQYLETSRIRKHELCAAAVMCNHTPLLVGVLGDPKPNVLRDLYKSWATRALKKKWELPASGTFFTRHGSVRKKEGEAIAAAVIYVARKQPNPLAVHIGDRWRPLIEEYDRKKRAP